MANLILFNKPFQVLSQFTDKQGRATLADYVDENKVYPAGRLDYDSEGLLLLTDSGALQHRISHPSQKLSKTYWVQLEGIISDDALQQLQQGVELKDGKTLPAKARRINPPPLWERHPPIRQRDAIPTSWIELSIAEGKNRQVRRMTAAVDYPTLRLVRYQIGEWSLEHLQPGEFRQITVNLPRQATNHRSKKPPHKRSYKQAKNNKG